MPRRSLRAKNSEANNGSKLDGAKTSQQKSDLLGEQTLESFYNPNEMKRQIADALKEPKNKAKREKNRANNNAKNGEGKRSKKVLVLSDEKEAKKMDYADAVRNTLSPRGNKEVTAEIVVESKSLKTPLTEEEKSICDNICSDINSNTNLSNCSFSKEAVCDLLKDAEIIEELEDSTWEVVSTGDCSINEDEDPFHLVASDEVMTTSSTNEADKENRNIKEQNNNNNVEMKAQGEPKTEPTSRKKIVVSRKYIGGPDLPEKLIKLGFQAMVGCQQQVEEDEDEKVS